MIKGDVIQINENHKWKGCLAVVDEVKSWGVQAYVPVPQDGNAFIRLMHGDYEYIGKAILVINEEVDEE